MKSSAARRPRKKTRRCATARCVQSSSDSLSCRSPGAKLLNARISSIRRVSLGNTSRNRAFLATKSSCSRGTPNVMGIKGSSRLAARGRRHALELRKFKIDRLEPRFPPAAVERVLRRRVRHEAQFLELAKCLLAVLHAPRIDQVPHEADHHHGTHFVATDGPAGRPP